MLQGKTVAVILPAYNEERQIGTVIDTMPDFVDRIIVVDDCSKDRTSEVVKEYIERVGKGAHIPRITVEILPTLFNRAEIVEQEIRKEEEVRYQAHTIFNDNDDDRIVLISNVKNGRKGAALRVGYKWCREHGIACSAVMDSDGQMDPSELESICSPIVIEGVDYVKGNRLSHPSAKRMIPPKRYFGNSVLSALTKIASGYWHVSDTQTGYTAISLNALHRIDLPGIYYTYGCPNDMLIKLNIAGCTVKEVPIKPVYEVGEQSKMKIIKVIPRISLLLIKGFFKRITTKYCMMAFHPIFLFYISSIVSAVLSLIFLFYIMSVMIPHGGRAVSVGTYLGFVLSIFSAIQLLGFAMFMDIQDNERLQK